MSAVETPVSTVKSDGMETDCKYRHERKRFDYNSNSPGLITLYGTRAEMTSATIDINLDWSYNSKTNITLHLLPLATIG